MNGTFKHTLSNTIYRVTNKQKVFERFEFRNHSDVRINNKLLNPNANLLLVVYCMAI